MCYLVSQESLFLRNFSTRMPQKPFILPLVLHRPAWLSLVLVFVLMALGAFGGQQAGVRLAFSGAEDITIRDTAWHLRRSLLILQAVTASSAFIVAPLLYLYFFAHHGIGGFFQWRQGYAAPILFTLGLCLAFMVVNTWFIQWNMAVKLPPWLRAFEVWAQTKEAALQRLTTLLTTFHSLTDLGVGMVVIGVIPAIGEELFFRGLVLPLCYKLTNNIHGAIGISAFVFSTIHLQFYGFVPRFLLGMLFGYIYWWTRDLAFPIAAHLFNNVFTLLMLFLYQQGIITQDITTPAVPSKAVLGFFAMLVVLLACYLRQLSKKHNP